MISGIVIGRRSFLISAGLLGIGASSGGIAGALVEAAEAAAAADVDPFNALSRFLTGAPNLDPELAGRAFAQLTALDPDFPQKAVQLAEAIKTAGAPNIDAFLASPAVGDGSLRTTMVTIVSAWYLGFTGTPIPLRAQDDTGFVTFTEARMYPPTIDATVRPTYARAGTDYWIDPPSFMNVPAAPPGLRSWGMASPQGIGAIPGAAGATSDGAPAPVSADP